MISNLTQQSWDAKTIELGGSILQSWAWGEFQKSLGQKIYRFAGDDFVNLAVETDLKFGKKYLYCPRGPVGEPESALVDLKKFSSDHSLVFARVEPQRKINLPQAIKNIQPTCNWVLALDQSEQELLINMKPKTRYNINLAQRKGIVVREGEEKDLINLWQLFLETAKRNNFRLHPQNYYLQMWQHLGPKHIKILLAEYSPRLTSGEAGQGQLLAGMILTLFGSTATYLHGGSSLKLKEAQAPYLLHWHAIGLAKSLGYQFYDFGGITADADPHPAWAGITRFKQGFGGLQVTYPGAYDLIYSPIWYNVYKQARLLRKILKSN